MKDVKVYAPPGRAAPVARFIDGLDRKLRDKVIRQLAVLPHTPRASLREPHFKHFALERYGSQYNYGGRNAVDYDVPELEYGLQSTTMTGVMERTILPGLQQVVANGSGGGYGIGGGGGPITELVEDTGSGSAPTVIPSAPQITVPSTPPTPT